jgi:shikimate kinase
MMPVERLIFLTGFAGSGKTSVGRLLARRLGMKFIDIDKLIERRERITIPDLFAKRGERVFRRIEQDAIRGVIQSRPKAGVISLGGGALQSPAVRKQVSDAGALIYLSCSVREIYRRLKDLPDRPLLEISPAKGLSRREARLERIRGLVNKRLPHYRQADIILSTTNRTPLQAARKLEHLLRKRNAQH